LYTTIIGIYFLKKKQLHKTVTVSSYHRSKKLNYLKQGKNKQEIYDFSWHLILWLVILLTIDESYYFRVGLLWVPMTCLRRGTLTFLDSKNYYYDRMRQLAGK